MLGKVELLNIFFLILLKDFIGGSNICMCVCVCVCVYIYQKNPEKNYHRLTKNIKQHNRFQHKSKSY